MSEQLLRTNPLPPPSVKPDSLKFDTNRVGNNSVGRGRRKWEGNWGELSIIRCGCSVVAVWCSVLQCFAVCCSVLQCVAVHCSAVEVF